MNIKFDQSPNFSPNRWEKVTTIVLHWWDDPAKKPALAGVIATFKNSASQVSAHYIVSDKTIVQMVKETDTAWHAGSANPFSIGIEIDPRTPGSTYQTVIDLIKDIYKRHKIISIKPHNEYMNTQCPGTIDLARIKAGVKGVTDMYAEPKPLKYSDGKARDAKGWFKTFAQDYDRRLVANKKIAELEKRIQELESADNVINVKDIIGVVVKK